MSFLLPALSKEFQGNKIKKIVIKNKKESTNLRCQ